MSYYVFGAVSFTSESSVSSLELEQLRVQQSGVKLPFDGWVDSTISELDLAGTGQTFDGQTQLK